MIVIVDAATGAQIDDVRQVDGTANGSRLEQVTGPSDRPPSGPIGVDPRDNAVHDSRTPPTGVSRVEGGDCETGNVRLETGQRTARVAVPLVVPAKIRVPSPDALPRERLEARLADAWRHRLTLVVAPAGSGKTTLLARFAAQASVPVGWYRAETWDADEASFVRHLEAALRSALPDLPGGWTSVEDVAKALDARPEPAAALVIDDGHALEGTAAEARSGASSTTPRSGWRSSSPAACRPRSTFPACACPASCSSSGRTTCGSAPGRSSSCSATSTTTRCCRATSRCWPAGPRAGRPACSCSTSRRAAGPPTSAGGS